MLGLSYLGEKVDLAVRLMDYHSKHRSPTPASECTISELQEQLTELGLCCLGDKATPLSRLKSYFNEFTLFQKLPLELRKIIWEEALPKQRVLEYRSHPEKENVWQLNCHKGLLPLMHTCHESRQVVSDRYARKKTNMSNDPDGPGPGWLIVIENDAIFFKFPKDSMPEEVQQVIGLRFTRVAFDITSKGRSAAIAIHVRAKDPRNFPNFVSQFKDLQEIWFIAEMESNGLAGYWQKRLFDLFANVNRVHRERKGIKGVKFIRTTEKEMNLCEEVRRDR